MGTDKHLKLRAAPGTSLGKVISYIQSQPVNNQELSGSTLQGRFLPFAMDRDDPMLREIAIRCACECEAWAKAIREYAGLGIPVISNAMMRGVSLDNGVSDKYDRDEEDEEDEEDIELSERKRQRRNDGMGF